MRRSKYTTEELLGGITDDNIHPAVDWGPDVGKEILPPELLYGIGDATLPMGDSPCIIAHICNDIGGWGKGFVRPLGKRYPEAETQYRAWFRRKTDPPFALGQVQFVEVKAQAWVANMIAQHGIGRQGPTPPIRYEALRGCLSHVRAFAQAQSAFVQMPRIGCGLAGGKWEEISKIVEEELAQHGLFVTVLDLPEEES
jgi:O-acetyl-ADP-ribose deacetylase (regulator of RNase III)